MIFSENRHPLFRIMLERANRAAPALLPATSIVVLLRHGPLAPAIAAKSLSAAGANRPER